MNSDDRLHPDKKELAAFGLGKLDDVAHKRVEQHITECKACCEYLQGLPNDDRVVSLLRDLDAPPVDEATSAQTDHPRKLIGTRVRYFGDYELLEEIARGGMGVVYRARQVQLNRIVAVKMILSGVFATRDDVRRFRSEAEAAARLQHPGIVPVYEVGEFEGQNYYSMGFVDGVSLADKLREGPLPPKTAAELIRQTAIAVQHAHDHGVIHRDLKPANILTDESGQPHVTDFGLARRIAVDQSLTRTGEILGTPSYMPPEQALGRNTEVREVSDVYSLGAVLYVSLTGRPPFQADNAMDTLRQVIEREPAPPRQLNPLLSRDLDTICLKCLQKERSRRYQSARELADDLQRCLNGEPIHARPISAVGRLWRWSRRNRVAATLTIALLLALISGLGLSSWFAWRASHNEAEAVRLASEKSELARQALDLAGEKEQLAEQEYQARRDAVEQARATAWNLYVARLFPMEDAWEQQDFGRLEALLEESTPGPQELDFRGWEWYFFQEQVRSASRSLSRHALPSRIDYCNSTRQVAAAGRTEITLVDIGGEDLRRLPLPTTAWQLAWHPAGSHIALADNTGLLYILSVADGVLSTPLAGHTERIQSITWADDGSKLATAEFRSGLIIVREAETYSITKKLPAPNDARKHVSSLDWHPDGIRLAAAFRFNSCGVWDTDTGEKLWSETGGGATGGPVAWSPDGTALAAGTTSGVFLRDELGRQRKFTPTRRIHSVAWHEDGKQIAIGQVDHSFTVWNSETDQVVHQRLHRSAVDSVHWIDGQRLMSASGLTGIRISQLDDRGLGQPLVETTGAFLDVCWHPEDQLLAIAPGGKLVDGNSGELVRIVEGHVDEQPLLAGSEISIGFHPNGGQLVAVNRNRASILDTASGGWVREFPVPEDGTIHNRVIWQAEPNIIHVVNSDGQYSRWDGDSGAQVDTRKVRDQLWSFDVSPDGSTIASGGAGGFAVEIYNTEVKKVIAHSRQHGWIRSVAYHPNGATLAAGDHVGRIRLIRTSDGAKIHELAAHQGPVYAVRYSPEGNRLASGGDDGNLRLWDTNTWQCVITIPLGRIIYDIEWSHDGRRLALACEHGAYVFAAHSELPASGYSEDVLKAQRRGLGSTTSVDLEQLALMEAPQPPLIDHATERTAAEWVLKVGGKLTVERAGTLALRIDDLEHLPSSQFQITAIDLMNRSKVVDDDLRRLSALKRLRHLNLRGTSVSDEGLRVLADVTSLDVLKLGESAVSGTGLEDLSRLTQLRSLTAIHLPLTNATFSNLPTLPSLTHLVVSFNEPGIDDGALAVLENFPNLQALDLLDAVTISADGLKHISRLQNLETLRLHRTSINDESLKSLADCPRLKTLDLGAVRSLTDQGFEFLKGIKTLEELRVPRTRFSDGGLAAVQRISELKKLDIAETLVSDDAIAQFRKARPDCEISTGR